MSRLPFFSTLSCSLNFLRLINLILGVACVPLIRTLLMELHPGKSSKEIRLMTLMANLFPVHFFFIFLYYTDTASTFFFLASWLAAIKYRYMTSGLLGTVSILIRQTNAVWVGFIAAWACIEMAQKIIQCHSATFSNAVQSSITRSESTLQIQAISMVQSLIKFPQIWFSLWPLVVPILGFIAFVIQNRGIVVGDRENHTPVMHVMQVFYFHAFTAVSIAPILASDFISYVSPVARRRKKNLYFALFPLVMASGTVAYLAARFTTLVHPFILADNRHYIFYLWRRVLQSQFLFRYLLLPLYAISPLALFSTFTFRTLGPLLRIVILVCTCIVLIPAHLVEFRYYTIPFFLHSFSAAGRASTHSMWLTILAYLVVNMLTIYVFLFKEFVWPDGSTARFMW
eukprot:jgi/Picsp_1/2256/NSC_05720-R1_dol-p-glc:glc man c -pp-dol alpha- -glucosyltransferase-like